MKNIDTLQWAVQIAFDAGVVLCIWQVMGIQKTILKYLSLWKGK